MILLPNQRLITDANGLPGSWPHPRLAGKLPIQRLATTLFREERERGKEKPVLDNPLGLRATKRVPGQTLFPCTVLASPFVYGLGTGCFPYLHRPVITLRRQPFAIWRPRQGADPIRMPLE